MRKVSILILISCFFITYTKCQTSKTNKIWDRSIFSLRLIKGSSSNNNDKQSSTTASLYSSGAGVKWLYLINEKFALSAEPMIHNKGYTNGSNKLKIFYIDFPVNIEKVKEISFFTPTDYFTIGLGIYGGYAISGKNINGYNNNVQKVQFGNAKTDERRRLDYGINFTTALSIATFFETGFNAQLGLNNVLPKDLQVDGNSTKLTSMGLFVGINTSFLKNKK